MKSTFITFIFSVVVGMTYGQKIFYVNGDLVLPGINLEYNFNEKHSLVLNSFYFPNVSYTSAQSYSEWDISHVLRNNIQYRYYYNKEKRSARGLQIQNNASNYFLAQMELAFVFPNPAINTRFMFAAGWGFKRFIGSSNWYYGAEFGIGAVNMSDENSLLFGPHYHFKLGYMLYKKSINTKL